MAFLGVFEINLKLYLEKIYKKNPKYTGFVKLGVRWAERDIYDVSISQA